MIWIAGYPRGDFGAGAVPGTKVLVASDRGRSDTEPTDADSESPPDRQTRSLPARRLGSAEDQQDEPQAV
jgi:hypothetical protein